MTIAQVTTPTEGLSSGYFTPLFLGVVLYVVLFMAGRALDARGDKRSETADDIGFVVMLLSAVYVGILAVVAVVSEMDLIWDMLRIMFVVIAFFGGLLLFLLVVFERGIGGLSRLRRRAR